MAIDLANGEGRSTRETEPLDAVKAGGFLTGTPADVIEQLKAVEECYPGLDRVVCSIPHGTPLAVALEQVDRFATKVMPAFRGAKLATRAAAD